jgi:hypothetical protein
MPAQYNTHQDLNPLVNQEDAGVDYDWKIAHFFTSQTKDTDEAGVSVHCNTDQDNIMTFCNVRIRWSSCTESESCSSDSDSDFDVSDRKIKEKENWHPKEACNALLSHQTSTIPEKCFDEEDAFHQQTSPGRRALSVDVFERTDAQAAADTIHSKKNEQFLLEKSQADKTPSQQKTPLRLIGAKELRCTPTPESEINSWVLAAEGYAQTATDYLESGFMKTPEKNQERKQPGPCDVTSACEHSTKQDATGKTPQQQVDFIEQHVSKCQWDRVGKMLQNGVDDKQHQLAVQEASAKATDVDFVTCIVPHCSQDQLEAVLPVLVERNMWLSVGKVVSGRSGTKREILDFKFSNEPQSPGPDGACEYAGIVDKTVSVHHPDETGTVALSEDIQDEVKTFLSCNKNKFIGQQSCLEQLTSKETSQLSSTVQFSQLDNAPSLTTTLKLDLKLPFPAINPKVDYPALERSYPLQSKPRETDCEDHPCNMFTDHCFLSLFRNLTRCAEYVDEEYFIHVHPYKGAKAPPLFDLRLENELCRLSTFSRTDLSVYPSRLAASGFYYDVNRRTVVCFSCGLQKNDWVDTRGVDTIHLQLSPNCTFLKERLGSTAPESEASGSTAVSQNTEKQQSRSPSPDNAPEDEATDASGSSHRLLPVTESSTPASILEPDGEAPTRSGPVVYSGPAAEGSTLVSSAGRSTTNSSIQQFKNPTAAGLSPLGKNHSGHSGPSLVSGEGVLTSVLALPNGAQGQTPAGPTSVAVAVYNVTRYETTLDVPSATSATPRVRLPVQAEQDPQGAPNQPVSFPIQSSGSGNNEVSGLDMRRAVSRVHALVKARLATFDTWPGRGLPNPRNLVLAGFFYMGELLPEAFLYVV